MCGCITTSFIIYKIRKQHKWPLIGEWINKITCSYIMILKNK